MTILSQNTSDHNSRRAFDSLLKSFGSWEAVAEGDVEDIAEAIKLGGLAQVKAVIQQWCLADNRPLSALFDLSPQELAIKTGIDFWFTDKLANIVRMEQRLLSETLTPHLLREAKRMGFADGYIGTLADRLPEQVRKLRHEWGILPVYKMVDTCAAEFAAARSDLVCR
jgi:hypothetical protein